MPPLMRPPYGHANLATQSALTGLGLRIVKWDVDTRDWEAGVTWEMVRDTALTATNGSIVLMHDHQTTVDALPSIISGLRSRGFELVTVTELLDTEWQAASP
jgi:peptidoglycan-N-acetylglucosamine deacetylase